MAESTQPRSRKSTISQNDPSLFGGKVPPQNIEAEKSLLGSILLDSTTFPYILEKLKPIDWTPILHHTQKLRWIDFYHQIHGHIYRAMMNLYERSQPIDLITLTSELKSMKLLKEVGGATYISNLTMVVPTAANALSYANLVEQASIRRRLIKAGTEIATKAYDSANEVGAMLGQAEKELFAVSDSNTKTDYTALSDLLVDAYDRMEMLSKNKGALRGLKTGFRDLDNKTAGLQKGDLIIIGARPAMGKTTFAQNLAYNVAGINKCGVLFFSMEMAKNEIVDRIISTTSNVDSWRIRTGNISNDDFAKIGDALGEMGEIPLYLDDTSSMTILELRNKARRAHHDHNIGLIIVDYLQLITGSDRYAGNRVQEVTEISRGLKTLARELEIPVIALAQLSRGVTGRDDPRPVLSDLRESGSIEQDADLVMFLHRPDYYHQEDGYEPTNVTELLMAKHRHGPIGKIELYFHPELLRFMSLDKTRE